MGNAAYWEIVQPSHQHVAPCVEEVDWGLDTRGLRIVAAFWAGIPVSILDCTGNRGVRRDLFVQKKKV